MSEPETGLRVERHEGVATVRLDRPHARNALNHALRQAIVRTCRELDDDEEIAVVVLTGTDPAFSAGVDLREAAATTRRPYERTNPGQALRGMSTPVIAAVNGPCVTGGLELALSCTFVVASERASFADTHARVGLIAGWGLERAAARRCRPAAGSGDVGDGELRGRSPSASSGGWSTTSSPTRSSPPSPTSSPGTSPPPTSGPYAQRSRSTTPGPAPRPPTRSGLRRRQSPAGRRRGPAPERSSTSRSPGVRVATARRGPARPPAEA